MNHVGNNRLGGSTAEFGRIGGELRVLAHSGSHLTRENHHCLWLTYIGFSAGNTTNTTSLFGRNVSGFSMTLCGSNLRIDLTHPGSFGAASDDYAFPKYPADSGGAGSAFDTSHTHPTGLPGPPYSQPAAQDGANNSQAPLTEDFQAHIEKVMENLPQTFHFHAISFSKLFRDFSFEVRHQLV